jgi:hypothetical protein
MNKDHRSLSRVAVFLWAVTLLLFTHTTQAQQALQVLHNHVRPAVKSGQAVPVGFVSPKTRMYLSIELPLRNETELDALLGRLHDPKSPDYRKFLSVAQFADQFAPTQEDYQTVVDFAKANGFAVTTSPNRLIVDISGTVAQVEQTFHVVMLVFQHPTEKRTFYSPDREPSLDLSVPVAHIGGLNNFSIPKPKVKRAAEGDVIPQTNGSGPNGLYLSGDMRAAYYGSGPLNGSQAHNGSPTDFGQAVGLYEPDGYDLADVYASFDGVPYSVPIFNVLLNGQDGLPDSGTDDVEQVLDIVQPIGMAPGQTSEWVFIGNNDGSIFSAMATTNCVGTSKNPQVCQQLSCSWGWEPDDPGTDETYFKEFSAQGQNLFVASGDAGAYTGNNTTDESYPAEDPYVTSVGGTELTTAGPGGAWVSEVAWPDSSGGPSDDGFGLPSWQSGIANSENDASSTIRNIPDVAAEANFDNFTCHLGACQGGWGGTSFAAPRWAGFLALANQQAFIDGATFGGNSSLEFINPTVYSLGEGSGYDFVFHDITSGNNNNGNGQSYNAVVGYDLVTGWGSPNGPDLIYALVGVDTPPSFTSGDAATFQVGDLGSFQMTATGYPSVVTFTTGATLPNGVTLSPSGLLSGTPAAGTGGTYNFLVTASNGVSPNATQLFLLTVNQPPAITSTNHATFQTGVFGSFAVTGTGYPALSYSTAGPLPGGVTLSPSGALSGTSAPGSGGVYVFTITASNGILPNATQTFTLTVDQSPTITSASSTTFQVGLLGSFAVTATGFPTAITFSTTGPLPSGVTLSPAGLLSGTPAAGTQGIYNFTIVASNGISPNGTQAFTLQVDLAPTITSANHTTFTIGLAGLFHVTATGFPAPTFSEAGALPAGVTLSSAGTLSGIPAPDTGGVYHITITASNGALPNATQAFTLTVVKAATKCAITASTEFYTKGQPIIFTAFVTTLAGEVDVPTGTVAFDDNGYSASVLGTEPLISGVSDLTAVLPTAPERQFIRAVYSGDSSFLGCDSAYLTENYQ